MLEQRSTETEFTEQQNCDPSLVRRAYQGMSVFNRTLGGVKVVRNFIENQRSIIPANRPLRVLDIGSGGCDIPLAVSRWARSKGYEVVFTCVDRNETAVRMCRSWIEQAGEVQVRVVQADIFHYEPSESFDCAVGSMFFHHFTDEEILTLVGRLRGYVKNALLISDLLRYTPIYGAIWLPTVFLSPELRHDVRASVRRGFKLTELRHVLQKLDGVEVKVGRHRFFRALAEVDFNPYRNLPLQEDTGGKSV